MYVVEGGGRVGACASALACERVRLCLSNVCVRVCICVCVVFVCVCVCVYVFVWVCICMWCGLNTGGKHNATRHSVPAIRGGINTGVHVHYSQYGPSDAYGS